MIRYALKCNAGHSFESWFQSAEAYDRLAAARHVACAVCGATEVEKDLMTPGVGARSDEAVDRPLSRPASTAEQALAELRRRVEAESTYVGPRFAEEARRMHAGETPSKPIHGEARLDEAKRLVEDGVPVAPLPFRPKRHTT